MSRNEGSEGKIRKVNPRRLPLGFRARDATAAAGNEVQKKSPITRHPDLPIFHPLLVAGTTAFTRALSAPGPVIMNACHYAF